MTKAACGAINNAARNQQEQDGNRLCLIKYREECVMGRMGTLQPRGTDFLVLAHKAANILKQYILKLIQTAP